MKNDAGLYREINTDSVDLKKNLGYPKTAQDDNFDGVRKDLVSLGKSLVKRTSRETLYNGDSTKEKVKTSYSQLEALKKEYEAHFNTAKEGLSQLEEALKSSGSL